MLAEPQPSICSFAPYSNALSLGQVVPGLDFIPPYAGEPMGEQLSKNAPNVYQESILATA